MIQIGFTSGYGTDATLIPSSIINAILITALSLYEHRGDSGERSALHPMSQALLDPYRVAFFGG
jgi:hypothetical protein